MEKKHDKYKGNSCVEKFYKDIKKLTTKITSFRKKEITPLLPEENKYILIKHTATMSRRIWM